MLNGRSLEAVEAALGPRGVRPLYESYSFARLPGSVEWALTGEHPERTLPRDALGALAEHPHTVVVMFIDAFGWVFLERYVERYRFLRRMMDDGVVSKLTSLFPSTTSAHVTCVHTGLLPAQTGLYEWFQYEPTLDEVIAPLLFSHAGDGGRNTLVPLGVDPAALLRVETIHERLSARGIGSHYVTPAEFTPSPYNDVVCRGGEAHPYKRLSSGLRTLGELVEAHAPEPRYLHYYFGAVDATAHRHGPESEQVDDVVDGFLRGAERHFMKRAARADRAVLVLTADHGMIATGPERTLYLNRIVPDLEPLLEHTRAGRPIVPAGSPRDLFLHVREDALEEAQGLLREALGERAEVVPTAVLIDEGYFGPERPSDVFRSRVGNLVVLPAPGRTVWWLEPGRFEHRHEGDHGGLTPAEMEIPCAVLEL